MTTKINTAYDEAVKAGYKGSRTQFIKAFNNAEIGEYRHLKLAGKWLREAVEYVLAFAFIGLCWSGTIDHLFKQLTTTGNVGISGALSIMVSSFVTYHSIYLLIKESKSKDETVTTG